MLYYLIKLNSMAGAYLETADPIRFSDRFAAKKFLSKKEALRAFQKLGNYDCLIEERRSDGRVYELEPERISV